MLTNSEFVSHLKTASKQINHSITDGDILTFVANEVADRISIYLNLETEEDIAVFDERLVKIAARIVDGLFTKTTTNLSGDNDDIQIKSMSDNGQSITFGDATKNYLATSTDGELFGGFAELLKPYRRLNVVH